MNDTDIEKMTPDQAVEKMLIDLAALVEDQALELAAANARIAELEGALAICEDALSRQSYQWTGEGPHPQEVIETVRAALKDQPE